MLEEPFYTLRFGKDLSPYITSVRDMEGFLPNSRELEIIIRKLDKIRLRGDQWIDRYNKEYASRQNKRYKRYTGKASSNGYVYLLQSGDLFKIGKAKDVRHRMQNHTTSNPSVKLLAYAYSPEYHSLEQSLHRQYEQYHVQGEWFRLTAPQVKVLKRRIYQGTTSIKSVF